MFAPHFREWLEYVLMWVSGVLFTAIAMVMRMVMSITIVITTTKLNIFKHIRITTVPVRF